MTFIHITIGQISPIFTYVISLHFPSSNPSIVQRSILTLWRPIQRLPIASHILLIWWYFHSVMMRVNEKASILTVFAGKVWYPSSSSTPCSSWARSESDNSFSHFTIYSFSLWDLGEVRRWLSCQSLVARTSPVVSWSNLPTTLSIGAYIQSSSNIL